MADYCIGWDPERGQGSLWGLFIGGIAVRVYEHGFCRFSRALPGVLTITRRSDKSNAGNPHAGFNVAGTGNVVSVDYGACP